MKKFETVIIDDERNVRHMLRRMLEQHFPDDIEIRGEAGDVQEGIDLIRRLKPDLLFLDIRLQSGTGFDLLSQLADQDFEVVFVTAYDQYALRAFKFSAFGYLLKPFRAEDIRDEIERLTSVSRKRGSQSGKRRKILIEHYDSGKLQRLIIPNVSGFQVIDLNEIIRLESENNYTHFFLSNGQKLTASRTIKEYEELLCEHGFFRTHQRHMINLKQIVSYQKGDGGIIILGNGTEIPLSRNRKSAFLDRFL